MPVPDSPRLRFRQYTPADEASVADLFGDPVARGVYPEMADAARVRRWIAWNLENYREFGYGLWVIELKASGAFVGDCGLTWQDVEGTRELEIGYHVLAPHRGHGYATEAALACLAYGFEHTDAKAICSIVRPWNIASCAVARRVHQSCREFMRGGKPMMCFYTPRAV